MRLFFVLAAAAAIQAFAPAAHAQPSYNCNVQLNPTEQAICDNADLSVLDREMAGKFRTIFGALNGDRQTSFRREQSLWRRDRDACGRAVGCIRANYVYRIGQFDRMTGNTPPIRQGDVRVLPDGTFERHNPDGSIDRRGPTGSIETQLPDGRIVTYQFSQVPGAGIPDLPPSMNDWAEQLEGVLLNIIDNILTDAEYSAYLNTEAGKNDLVLVDWRVRSITYLTRP